MAHHQMIDRAPGVECDGAISPARGHEGTRHAGTAAAA